MPIRSGIGIGEAQVYDTSGIANQYAKQVYNNNLQLQKQALENQKKNERWLDEISTTVAGAKSLGNGLHPNDAKAIIGYNDKIRSLYNQAATAKTPTEQATIRADINQAFQEANTYANDAKIFRKSVDDLGKNMVELHPEDYTDEDKTKLQLLTSGSYNDAVQLGYKTVDPFTFKRKPNDAPLLKAYDDLDKFIKNNAGKDLKDITTETVKDSKTGLQLYRSVKKVKPEEVYGYLLTNIKANDGLKYNLKTKFQELNPGVVPTDDDLTKYFINEKNKVSGTDWNTVKEDLKNVPKEPKEPKDSESEKETKLWESYTQGAFNPNTRNQYIKNLQILAGDKAKLSITKEGYVKVVGSPEQKLNIGNGLSVLTPAPSPKDYIAKDPSELIGHLKTVGVNPKGISSIERLNKSNNTSRPSSSRRAQDGYRINQVEGGYKYIGGPADDKNSWVRI